ncbi:MAG TPA: DUF4424 domain-containing protein [Allosphingosinicella sp.]|nr:DUF4424 domain-containing protein [Allosphingosinicella sp.]
MSRTLLPPAGALIASLLLGQAAVANDSSAEKAAGGLVLRQNNDIDMVSEDLYVSPAEVRVRYVFRNRAPQARWITVAFPMPDRDMLYEMESEVAYPEGFRTLVDGRPVRMSVERRAMVDGVDRTAELTRLRIPVAPPAGERSYQVARRIGQLPRAAQERLARLGLIDADALRDAERQILPRWTVKETWHWDQVFPAGRDLRVEHRYRPGLGGTAGVPLASRDFRNSDDGRQYQREYCTDAAFLAALDRISARAEQTQRDYPMESRLRYILTTGGNWRSPIGDFRLVVDKGDPNAIVSFCGEGVRRISPTQFEVRHRNWRPDRDLAVLIVSVPRN